MISDYLEEKNHIEEEKTSEEMHRLTNQSINNIRQIK
jgi:hypothetical protein